MIIRPYKLKEVSRGKTYVFKGRYDFTGVPLLEADDGWVLMQSRHDKISWRNKQIRKITKLRIFSPQIFKRVRLRLHMV